MWSKAAVGSIPSKATGLYAGGLIHPYIPRLIYQLSYTSVYNTCISPFSTPVLLMVPIIFGNNIRQLQEVISSDWNIVQHQNIRFPGCTAGVDISIPAGGKKPGE